MQILSYTEEHQIFRESVKRFVAKELTPHVDAWEKQGIVDRSFWRKKGHRRPVHGAVGVASRNTSLTPPGALGQIRAMRMLYGAVGLCLCLWLSGCGDGGTPSEIRELTLGATTNPMGDDEAIHGIFEFTDLDGDAESIAFEVLLPDGTVQELPPQAVEGLSNHKHGTVSFSLIYSRDTVGRYEVTVWLLDAHGLESNRLTGTTYSRM